MPNSQKQETSPRRSPLEFIRELLPIVLPFAGVATSYFSKLPEFVRWLLLLASITFPIYWYHRNHKRELRRLKIKNPDELRLSRDDFRGRSDDVALITQRIINTTTLCLLGDSGCGKTTLIHWGLRRNAALTQRLEPVTLEAYGTDWITGPLLELITRLESQSNPANHVVGTGKDITSLVSILDQELASKSKPVLIIFDQFDHYLSAFRTHLSTSGEPLNEAGLKQANLFWNHVLGLAEQGKLNCLFVVETKWSWLTQPFVGGRLHRLDSLKGEYGYARGLLNEILVRAGSPANEPEIEELVDLISEELERSDLLPVKLDFTLRSLPYLKALHPKAYPGLDRLIALGVRGEISRVAKEDLSYKEVLSLLLELVAEGEDKPRPRTTEQLALSLGRAPEPTRLEAVLESLAAIRITKREPDPTGPQRWTLYHEFLVRVLRALREETLQEQGGLLRSFAEYQKAKWPAKLFTLLRPWIAVKPLLGQVRGRLKLGNATGFALANLLLLPVIALLISLAVLRINYFQSAERIGTQIVTLLDSHTGLGDEDLKAIWLLHYASTAAQRKTLENFFESGPNADRFITHADLIIQSLSSLHPAESATSVFKPVWESYCLNELQNLRQIQVHICALIENELPECDIRTWERYLGSYAPERVLVSLFTKINPSRQDEALTLLKQAISAGQVSDPGILAAHLLRRSLPEKATQRAPMILSSLAAQEGPGSSKILYDFWNNLDSDSSQLREDALRMLNDKLRANAGLKEDRLEWAKSVANLHSDHRLQLDSNVTKEAKEILLDALRKPSSDKFSLLSILGGFEQEMSESEIELVRSSFLANFESCNDASFTKSEGIQQWNLNGMYWLLGRLRESQAELALESFSEGKVYVWPEKKPAETSHLFRLATDRLNSRLSEASRFRLIDRYRNRLRSSVNLQVAAPLLLVLTSLQSTEQHKRQEELVTELRRVVAHEESPNTRALANVVRAWWPDLEPRSRQSIEDLMKATFKKMIASRGRWDELSEIADALDDLDISLSEEESRNLLKGLLQHSRLPCDALAPLVREETLDLLVSQGFRYPVCPLGMSESVARKLEKLDLWKLEEVGQHIGGIPMLDRLRVVAWARRKGYNLETVLLYPGKVME